MDKKTLKSKAKQGSIFRSLYTHLYEIEKDVRLSEKLFEIADFLDKVYDLIADDGLNQKIVEYDYHDVWNAIVTNLPQGIAFLFRKYDINLCNIPTLTKSAILDIGYCVDRLNSLDYNPHFRSSDLFPKFEIEDKTLLQSIVHQLKVCISDIEFSDYYDPDNEKHIQILDMFSLLLGDFGKMRNCTFSEEWYSYTTVILPSIVEAKTYLDLWRSIDFDYALKSIWWGIWTSDEVPDYIVDVFDLSSSKETSRKNVYSFELTKYINNKDRLIMIDCLITDNENHAKTELVRRISVLYDIINYIIEKIKDEKNIEDERIKNSERNRILSNLSHSIKNMLKSVIDPLMNLREEIPQKAVIIDNAIKGANLIREIVNAINLSFQTTLDDLKWDVRNPDGESMTLQDMVVDSLRYSISNMFDSRYFPAFSEKYFPKSLDQAEYNRIKQEWNDVYAGNVSRITCFLDRYMFHFELSLDESRDYNVGNEKSSAIKLMILFQEIIFNAVKYSSYVLFSERQVEIILASHGDKMELAVKNSFNPKVQPKTTGVGKLVIENFAKVLGCSPVIVENENTYSISLEFDNLWYRNKTDA